MTVAAVVAAVAAIPAAVAVSWGINAAVIALHTARAARTHPHSTPTGDAGGTGRLNPQHHSDMEVTHGV